MEISEIYLSLIIPCYNVAAYLGKTIESLEQLVDAKDVEFLFVDDGSKDETLQILRDFEAKDKRAKVITQQNQGVSAARNNVLGMAKGRYVFLLDGDDFLNADTVQVIRSKMENADLLIPNITISEPTKTCIRLNNIPCGHYTVESFYSTCKFFPTSPQLVYRTSIIKENALAFNPLLKSGEVYDFTISFLQHTSSIVVIEDAFYNYVMRESSATHRPNFNADKSSLLLLSHFAEIDTKLYPWVNSGSFAVTDFRLIIAFTYMKYVHQKLTSPEAISTVQEILSDNNFKTLMKKVAYGPNKLLKERIIAIYMHLMPQKLGFKLMAKLSKYLKN